MQSSFPQESSGVGSRVLRWSLLLLALFLCRRAAPLPGAFGPSVGIVMVRWANPQAFEPLGVIWYYTYSAFGPVDARHHRVMMVRPHDDEALLEKVLRHYPGRWWIVGNEPNDPYQDNLSPVAYAAFYHRFERLARRVDPDARLVTAGIANADWQWAEAFWNAYQQVYGHPPRVDAWNVHNYILLPEHSQVDIALFQARLVSFRAWMEGIGEGEKPLLLGEFGVLMGKDPRDPRYVPPEAIAAYIQEAVAWLCATDYVDAWAWFANDTQGLFNGDLYDAQDQLTPVGQAYRQAIQESCRLLER